MDNKKTAVQTGDGTLKRILILLAAFLYCFSPIDVIPDFIPVLGWVDDLAVAIYAGKKFLK